MLQLQAHSCRIVPLPHLDQLLLRLCALLGGNGFLVPQKPVSFVETGAEQQPAEIAGGIGSYTGLCTRISMWVSQ